MTVHATFTADPDKALCRVRISHRPEERSAAVVPNDVTCDTCAWKLWRRIVNRCADTGTDVPEGDHASTWPPGVGGALEVESGGNP